MIILFFLIHSKSKDDLYLSSSDTRKWSLSILEMDQLTLKTIPLAFPKSFFVGDFFLIE